MNSKISINATAINCYDENGITVVGVEDNIKLLKKYLIISRFNDEKIDDSIGVLTHLCEIEFHNAIARVTLSRNFFNIDIDQKRVKEVGVSSIEVALFCSDMNYELLKEYLNKIFTGSSTKLII